MKRRFLYLAVSSNGLHKIGWSRQPLERLRQVAAEVAQSVRLVHHVKTEHATWLEGHLYRRFEAKRVRGEWFRLEADDVAYVVALTPDAVPALRQAALSEPPTTRAVKIDAVLWKKIKLITAHAGEAGMQRYINAVLRPAVDLAFRAALDKLNGCEQE